MLGVAWGTFSSCPLLLQDTVWSKRVGRLLMGDLRGGGEGGDAVRTPHLHRAPPLPSPRSFSTPLPALLFSSLLQEQIPRFYLPSCRSGPTPSPGGGHEPSFPPPSHPPPPGPISSTAPGAPEAHSHGRETLLGRSPSAAETAVLQVGLWMGRSTERHPVHKRSVLQVPAAGLSPLDGSTEQPGRTFASRSARKAPAPGGRRRRRGCVSPSVTQGRSRLGAARLSG